jgi:hypothetical protein
MNSGPPQKSPIARLSELLRHFFNENPFLVTNWFCGHVLGSVVDPHCCQCRSGSGSVFSLLGQCRSRCSVLMTKNVIILKLENLIAYIKNCNILNYRTSKLQDKLPGIKKEHPAHENINFRYFWVIFCLLDPDPDPAGQNQCRSGSRTNSDLLLKKCR